MSSRAEPLISLENAYLLRGAGRAVAGPDRRPRTDTTAVAALRGLTLQVHGGERVVVRGPSGSGKSTLVSVITAELPVSAGSARVLGRDTSRLSTHEIRVLQRSGMGIVSQRTGLDLLPELSCLANVALQSRLAGHSRRRSTAAARDMLERFGVGDLASRRPATLSGGERQRVALAAALAHRPKIIVLDEPTGELDARNAAAVYDVLRELGTESDSALVVVTHDLESDRIATRVVTIDDGRLSTERPAGGDADEALLVVDGQGWVWLPRHDRATAGIADRVLSRPASGALTLVPAVNVLRVPDPVVDRYAGVSTEVLACTGLVIPLGANRTVGPLTFRCTAGQIIVLTGRSGSGKTSVLSAILGQRAPVAGEVRVHSTRPVACMPQTTAFSERQTVGENLELARAIRREPVSDPSALLASLGMEGFADRRVAELSGGERQRVALARVLGSDASLMLIDEPTSQVDRGLAARVVLALRRAASQGATVICATHDKMLIDAADLVVSLDEVSPDRVAGGHVVARGTTVEERQ